MADAGFAWLLGKNKQDNELLYQVPAGELRLGVGPPAVEKGFFWHSSLRAAAKQERIAKKFSNDTDDETAGFVTVDICLGYGFGCNTGLPASRIDLLLSNLINKKYHEHLTGGMSGCALKAPGRWVTLAVSGSF